MTALERDLTEGPEALTISRGRGMELAKRGILLHDAATVDTISSTGVQNAATSAHVRALAKIPPETVKVVQIVMGVS